MTAQQTLILQALVKIHRQQPSDSAYFAPDGGVYTSEVAKACGLDPDVVEGEADSDKTAGYVEVIIRSPKSPYRGLRPLQKAIDYVDQLQAQKDADEAAARDLINQANATAQAELDSDTSDLSGDLTAITNATTLAQVKPYLIKAYRIFKNAKKLGKL